MANWEGLETAMAARFGGAVLGDDRGFRFRSGLTSGFTNAVLRTSVEPDALAALVADARAWFPAGIAWRWLVSDLDCPADLAARLPALGFERRRVLPAMARDLAGLDVGARRHRRRDGGPRRGRSRGMARRQERESSTRRTHVGRMARVGHIRRRWSDFDSSWPAMGIVRSAPSRCSSTKPRTARACITSTWSREPGGAASGRP